jgi:hypothetical protein
MVSANSNRNTRSTNHDDIRRDNIQVNRIPVSNNSPVILPEFFQTGQIRIDQLEDIPTYDNYTPQSLSRANSGIPEWLTNSVLVDSEQDNTVLAPYHYSPRPSPLARLAAVFVGAHSESRIYERLMEFECSHICSMNPIFSDDLTELLPASFQNILSEIADIFSGHNMNDIRYLTISDNSRVMVSRICTSTPEKLSRMYRVRNALTEYRRIARDTILDFLLFKTIEIINDILPLAAQ